MRQLIFVVETATSSMLKEALRNKKDFLARAVIFARYKDETAGEDSLLHSPHALPPRTPKPDRHVKKRFKVVPVQILFVHGAYGCHDAASVFVALAKPNDDLVSSSVYPPHLSNLVVALLDISLIDADRVNPHHALSVRQAQVAERRSKILCSTKLTFRQYYRLSIAWISPAVGQCLVGWRLIHRRGNKPAVYSVL